MNPNAYRLAATVGMLLILGAGGSLLAQPTGSMATEFTPKAILGTMERVADWQLANPSKHRPTDWTQGAGDAGFMALAGISGNAKYRDAMFAMAETNRWQPGPRKFHADDYAVGQTYTELYFLYRDPRMIAPLKARFDDILEHPSTAPSLEFTQPKGKAQELWSWCDALFMAPPAWVRLYYATGDERYLDFGVKEWWRTTDYLYDKEEHLYFRDSTYFNKREANGKKIFWSRGNGWVMGGLVRLLQYLPMNSVAATPSSQKGAGDASSPDAPSLSRDGGVARTFGDGASPLRARFEQLFKEMSAKILTCQQPDGLWRASLLDPDSYPLKETSGSGFYTYALAWGVNQGLLDRAKFEPAVRKAWSALVGCVDADGKLTHVQPIGADPKKFAEDSTEVYGVGAFLLAGSEVYRMAIFENAPEKAFRKIYISNKSSFNRDCETVEIRQNLLPEKAIPTEQRIRMIGVKCGTNSQIVEAPVLAVMDGLSSRLIISQGCDLPNDTSQSFQAVKFDKLLFQVDLAPNETRTFYVLDANGLPTVPPPIVKTMARYVPERYDDFAWESDRIAHRTYGQALIKAEGSVSSGPDVWIKKNRGLVVDTMYRTGHYHQDNGEFMDDYRVGKSRGCGGLGIWDGKKLFVSGNYRSWKLITTGPIRSEFELTYDAWDAGRGRMVFETKRYSIDAGSWFTKAQCTFSSDDKSPLTIGVGLAERACGPGGAEQVGTDKAAGWMTYWQPEDGAKGTIGVAVVLPKNSVSEFTTDAPDLPKSKLHEAVKQPTTEGAPAIRNLIAISQAEVGKPFTYYFGACWDRSGDFTNRAQWEAYVKRFAERRDQPLKVTAGN